jgi:hypothetical protein
MIPAAAALLVSHGCCWPTHPPTDWLTQEEVGQGAVADTDILGGQEPYVLVTQQGPVSHQGLAAGGGQGKAGTCQ